MGPNLGETKNRKHVWSFPYRSFQAEFMILEALVWVLQDFEWGKIGFWRLIFRSIIEIGGPLNPNFGKKFLGTSFITKSLL